jgi:hypothetical protein
VGVAPALADDDAVAIMGFGGEGEQAAGGQHTSGFRQHRREFGDIDHGIRREDEIGAGLGLAAQAPQHVGDFQLRIERGGTGLLDHPRRQVDADEAVDIAGKGSGRKPRAAAEIDRAPEIGRLLRGAAHRQHRLEQQRRAAIAEIADQRGLEPRRVLVKQRLHIG